MIFAKARSSFPTSRKVKLFSISSIKVNLQQVKQCAEGMYDLCLNESHLVVGVSQGSLCYTSFGTGHRVRVTDEAAPYICIVP